MDFKTKNSNWSHFEGYESPPKENAADDETDSYNQHENEDFPWSDPPQTTPTHNNAENNNMAHPTKPPAISIQHRRTSSIETIRNYNANIMPRKLIMIRHGQSEGNVDEVLYSTKPDNNLRLTKLGWDSARMAGKALREEIGERETVHFVVSPYVRAVETFHGLASAWVDPREFDGIEGRNSRLKAWYTRLMEMGE
jgi:hypothetical protein